MDLVEQIKQLSQKLSSSERKQVVDYLSTRSEPKAPVDLFGFCKIASDSTFDLDAALYEIRHEWEEELELYK